MSSRRKFSTLTAMFLSGLLILTSGCTLTKKASEPSQQQDPSKQQGATATTGGNSAPAGAAAVPDGNTLDTILKRKKLIAGVGIGNPPWGFYDKDNQPTGFDVELVKAIAKELGVAVEIVPTEANNRIPYLLTGKVDMVVATFAATPERAKSVAFTAPYAPFRVSLLTHKKETAIRSYRDLSGKSVAVVRGSTQDILLTELAPKDAQIVRYEDDPSSRLAFTQGKTETLAGGEVGLLQMIKQNPDYELKGVIGQTFPTIGARRFDQDWLNWLNIFLMNYGATGKLGRLYEKYFEVPMSPALPTY